MSGEVIAFKDLKVAPQGEVMDFTFFNKRFLELTSAINELALRQDDFDNTSNELIALGLQRINDTLGPFLTSLQEASQLGFLVCEATGIPVSFAVGVDVQLIVNSAGKGVFTPTPWLLALDENDYTNWAILSFTAYDPDTGVLACGCVYTTQHKASARWSVSCNSAMLAAETNLLNQAQTAANQTAANAASVATLITQVTQLIQIVQSGPVISVAGRNGNVVLQVSDITGLLDALGQKAGVSDLTAGLATKQPLSTLLSQFAALATAADKLPFFNGPASIGLAAFTALGRLLVSSLDAASARTNLGLGDIATHAASEFATPASVGALIGGAVIQSAQIAANILAPTVTTAYAFQPSDNGKVVWLSSTTPIVATLPATLPAGWQCMVVQGGTGQVTLACPGGTLGNRQNQVKTAGLYAVVSIIVVAQNAGNTTAWCLLGGDTAA